MTTSSDSPAPSSAPLIDSPLAELMDWDSPFRHSFIAGSAWAPWQTTAAFPPSGSAEVRTGITLPTVKPPEPPAPGADDEAYKRYRRDYERRLDEAYDNWKRSIFVSLFEPWIIDRRAAEAARLLKEPIVPPDGASP